MKKIVAGMLTTMLLTLTMGITAFASTFPSPGNETALNQVAKEWNEKVTGVSGRGSNNNIVEVTRNQATAEQVSKGNTAAKQISDQAQVMAMTDLSVSEGTDTSKGITITLSVSGVQKGDSVYVLHKLSNGQWETLKPSSVENGKVTVTLYSFSPIMVVKYPADVTVPVSDPIQNQPGSSNSSENNNNSESNTNSNNTTGDTQSNSNNQSNNNDQSNTQTNNQNNPVNVDQNVTVNYPDKDGSYDKGYNDGYAAGKSNVGSTSGSSAYVVSPKTGAALPALPILAGAALAGIAVCGKKARNNH